MMMKRILATVGGWLLSALCVAAPFLVPDPIPAAGPQPKAGKFTINAAAPVACPLAANAAGLLQMKCDLASITAPGTYTLIASYDYDTQIVNTSGGATVVQGGTASSAPFLYKLQTPAAPGPTLSVTP